MSSSWQTSLRDLRTLYWRELRSALRERTIVINSVLLPLLLYPVLLWLIFTAMSFVRGQEERFVSRIAFLDLPAAHQELRERLANDEDERFEILEFSTLEEAVAAVRSGDVDLVAHATKPPPEAAALDGNFALELVYDESKDRSETAHRRFERELVDYRRDWVDREASARGIDGAQWDLFAIERENVASGKDMGAFMLGLMVPLLMVIMIAVGCFYPAIDATAGERERSTWETLMTVSASRSAVVGAKYLYVATLGATAGLLNLGAMAVSMGTILQPLMSGREDGLSFQVPMEALPLMAISALLLALFIAAGMMLFAAFARNFKEGQSMISPFYLLCILPPLLVNSPDVELTLGWALVPIANVALVFRSAIGGVYPWDLIGVVFVVELATILALLWVVRWVLSFEDVQTGDYGGDLTKFLKDFFRKKEA